MHITASIFVKDYESDLWQVIVTWLEELAPLARSRGCAFGGQRCCAECNENPPRPADLRVECDIVDDLMGGKRKCRRKCSKLPQRRLEGPIIVMARTTAFVSNSYSERNGAFSWPFPAPIT